MSAAQPTEMKITIGGAVDAGATGAVDNALRTLGLDDGDRRWVWFLEDLTPGVTALPLLSAGVIVRLRLNPRNNKSDEADSTIKLRPARRSQLLPPWHDPHQHDHRKYRIEVDWAGHRRALAASCVADVPPEHVPVPYERAAGDSGDDDGGWSPEAAFSSDQHDFLRACTRLPVALSGLTCLGPVQARRWKNITLQPPRGTGKEMTEVVAERWTVGELDFLELSVRVDAGGDARAAHTDFEAAVRATGLHFPEEQETKTRRVLQHLADRVTTDQDPQRTHPGRPG